MCQLHQVMHRTSTDTKEEQTGEGEMAARNHHLQSVSRSLARTQGGCHDKFAHIILTRAQVGICLGKNILSLPFMFTVPPSCFCHQSIFPLSLAFSFSATVSFDCMAGRTLPNTSDTVLTCEFYKRANTVPSCTDGRTVKKKKQLISPAVHSCQVKKVLTERRRRRRRERGVQMTRRADSEGGRERGREKEQGNYIQPLSCSPIPPPGQAEQQQER